MVRRTLLDVAATQLARGRAGWLARQAVKAVAVSAGWRLGDRALAGPVMGELLVTYRCDARCPMCDLPARTGDDEPDTARLLDLVDQFAEIGTSGLSLSGGEPLLRPDLFDVIDRARHRGMAVAVSTNGRLLTPGRVRRLVASGPDSVNVSLDGATAGVHDALRGRPGTFDRVVAGLRRLAGAARGTRTSVVAVMALGPGNAGQLEAVARLVSGIGGVRLGILPVHHVVDPGGGRPPETRVRTGSGMQGLSRRLRDLGPLLRGTGSRLEGSPTYLGWLERAFAGEPFPIRCNAGYTSLSVDGAGRVYPCGPFVVAGRHSTMLGARRLRDVWNSPEHRRARREATACRACFWNCQSELSIALPLL